MKKIIICITIFFLLPISVIARGYDDTTQLYLFFWNILLLINLILFLLSLILLFFSKKNNKIKRFKKIIIFCVCVFLPLSVIFSYDYTTETINTYSHKIKYQKCLKENNLTDQQMKDQPWGNSQCVFIENSTSLGCNDKLINQKIFNILFNQ